MCDERYDKKDEETLRTFFGKNENKKGYVEAIDNFETDKFRPLVNFLKELTNDTEQKNLELLAWLMDFKPRPFRVWASASAGAGNTVKPGNDEIWPPTKPNTEPPKCDVPPPRTNANPTKPTHNSRKPALKGKVRMAIFATVAAVSLGGASYWLKGSGPKSCMSWNVDHYQSVPCTESRAVAMDAQMLKDFRKITDWNTITRHSKGSVWYVKVNDSIEFYTADGFHPTVQQLRLHPITDYIIKKYIVNRYSMASP